MSDDLDSSTPTPARAGSGADLARRMDRMEGRQDSMEATLGNLSQTVARVEINQKHSEELNLLRHDALRTGLDTLTGTVGQHMARIEGIISGEIETTQSRQGKALVADFSEWRRSIDEHVDASNLLHTAQAARGAGRFDTLTWTKTVLLALAALMGPVVAVIVALSK